MSTPVLKHVRERTSTTGNLEAFDMIEQFMSEESISLYVKVSALNRMGISLDLAPQPSRGVYHHLPQQRNSQEGCLMLPYECDGAAN